MRVEVSNHERLVGWLYHILKQYGIANLDIRLTKTSFQKKRGNKIMNCSFQFMNVKELLPYICLNNLKNKHYVIYTSRFTLCI